MGTLLGNWGNLIMQLSTVGLNSQERITRDPLVFQADSDSSATLGHPYLEFLNILEYAMPNSNCVRR